MNEVFIYRVQDKDGRGPFKPGFTKRWTDYNGPLTPPTFLEQFGPVHRNALPGEHVGCGCRSLQQLRLWFTPKEMKWLLKHGYQIVKLDVVRILAESDSQLVFARHKPLHVGAVEVKFNLAGDGAHREAAQPQIAGVLRTSPVN